MKTLKNFLTIAYVLATSKNTIKAVKEFIDFIRKISEKNKQIKADGKKTKEEIREFRQLVWKELKEVVDPIIDEL